MSLLTDPELNEIARDKFHQSRVAQYYTDGYRAMADAEHAKTVRVVHEWFLAKCTDHPPYTEWNRYDCPECTWTMLEALSKGEMPRG